MPDSLQPHVLQHTRLPCPSLLPEFALIHVHLVNKVTISSFTSLFSFCPQSFPASGSFPVHRLFTSGGLNNGASASASVFALNIQGWFPSGLTGLISLQFKGFSRDFSSTTVLKHQFFSAPPLWSKFHIHTWLLEKSQLWQYGAVLAKWVSYDSSTSKIFYLDFFLRYVNNHFQIFLSIQDVLRATWWDS